MQQMQSLRAQVSPADCSICWSSVILQDEPTFDATAAINSTRQHIWLPCGTRAR